MEQQIFTLVNGVGGGDLVEAETSHEMTPEEFSIAFPKVKLRQVEMFDGTSTYEIVSEADEPSAIYSEVHVQLAEPSVSSVGVTQEAAMAEQNCSMLTHLVYQSPNLPYSVHGAVVSDSPRRIEPSGEVLQPHHLEQTPQLVYTDHGHSIIHQEPYCGPQTVMSHNVPCTTFKFSPEKRDQPHLIPQQQISLRCNTKGVNVEDTGRRLNLPPSPANLANAPLDRYEGCSSSSEGHRKSRNAYASTRNRVRTAVVKPLPPPPPSLPIEHHRINVTTANCPLATYSKQSQLQPRQLNLIDSDNNGAQSITISRKKNDEVITFTIGPGEVLGTAASAILQQLNFENGGNFEVTVQTSSEEHGSEDTMDTDDQSVDTGLSMLHAESDSQSMTSPSSPLQLSDEGPQRESELTEQPVYYEGRLAVCQSCGYTSVDFNHCQRCRRKLPQNVRSVSVSATSSQNTNSSGKYYIHPVKTANPSSSLSPTPSASTSSTPKKTKNSGECPAKKKRTMKKSRKIEEPVCLTISSDEEDNPAPSSSEMICAGNKKVRLSDPAVNSAVLQMEPIITEHTTPETYCGNQIEGPQLEAWQRCADSLIQCRTVRIGSYKVVPHDKVRLSSQTGLRLTVPSIEESTQYVTLNVLYKEIVKVLIHFGRGMPVLFIYTTAGCAAKIRTALNMTPAGKFYYDPTSSNDTVKRITLLPIKMEDDNKSDLKILFSNPAKLLGELNTKEANDILVRASPKELQTVMKKHQPLSVNTPDIQTIMVYPPPPVKGGIPINTEDYACLGEDQFLNDVIIDFYLKYVTQSMLNDEDRNRTHVFSSFFYKRLTTRPLKALRRTHNPTEDNPSATPAEKRHSRVRSWTKTVNLFTKDFIIIPINESNHWFLAIVCFPGLAGGVRMSDGAPVDPACNMRPPKRCLKPEAAAVAELNRSMVIGSTTITPITLESEDSDRDEAEPEDDDDDMDDSSSDEDSLSNANRDETTPTKEKNEAEPSPLKQDKMREPIKQPCILIFDSIAGTSRSRVVATLRDYLRCEYRAKYNGHKRDFSKDVMKGACPKIPQQDNYTDCGLYLLQYVEAFFQSPIEDYHIPIKTIKNWFPADIVRRKRYDIQQLLHQLMVKYNVNVSLLNLPLLDLAPPEAKKTGMLVDYSEHSDEEYEEQDENNPTSGASTAPLMAVKKEIVVQQLKAVRIPRLAHSQPVEVLYSVKTPQ